MISELHSAATRRQHGDSAATRRHDVAMGADFPYSRAASCDSAAERRHDVAMGVSPWTTVPTLRLSPKGATRGIAARIPVALSGLERVLNAHHGLTPVATACRPFGTETQGKLIRSSSKTSSAMPRSMASSALLSWNVGWSS